MSEKKRIVVLTGAGISKESGIPTFRGSDGLWEGYEITKVASPWGWREDPALVLDFYNQRRNGMLSVEPNEGHRALTQLEAAYDVQIVTQNIDNLHEQAGSSNVLHLHGLITLARSSGNPDLLYALDDNEFIELGDLCDEGHQLRPHIVWFGEDVPEFPNAVEICQTADYLLIVGTSMVVYPANTLVEYAPEHAKIYIIDPNKPDYENAYRDVTFVEEPASVGVPLVVEELLQEVAGA